MKLSRDGALIQGHILSISSRLLGVSWQEIVGRGSRKAVPVATRLVLTDIDMPDSMSHLHFAQPLDDWTLVFGSVVLLLCELEAVRHLDVVSGALVGRRRIRTASSSRDARHCVSLCRPHAFARLRPHVAVCGTGSGRFRLEHEEHSPRHWIIPKLPNAATGWSALMLRVWEVAG